LSVISFHWLFAGTGFGFLASALFVLSVSLPLSPAIERVGGIYTRTTRGLRIYLKTPRLKGLLALTLAAAAASAMVIVNTIVIVRDQLGLGQSAVAITLASYGGGSMLAALLLPRLLDKLSDRAVMIVAACALTVGLVIMAALTATFQQSPSFWYILLAGWFALGVAYSASVTPSGRLLRRSANADDRPAVFAAQFALSHGCWLIAYPLAGQIGAGFGQATAFGALAILAGLGVVFALILWPANENSAVPHSHDDLPPDHPHLREAHSAAAAGAHDFVIDDLHCEWPR
jgi:predicted MFS family arabinose efflux permease